MKTTLWLLLSTLLLLVACSTASQQRLARYTGAVDPLLSDKLTAFVRRQAPELIPFLDSDNNGRVTLSELAEIDFRDPATLALLVAALQRHLAPADSTAPPAYEGLAPPR